MMEGCDVDTILREIREGVQETGVRVARIEERQIATMEHVRSLNGKVADHAEKIARLDERAKDHGEHVKELRGVAVRWGAGLAGGMTALLEALRQLGGWHGGKHP